MAGQCKHSCQTATQTLEWITAIIDFIRPYAFLINAHVVNFFKDRLWEAVDKEWVDCLRNEPVENLLKIPSGVVQDNWPDSLKEFILTLRSLVFPREQIYPDLLLYSLDNVLTQGMNPKKRHEVEILSAFVNSISKNIGSRTVIDVGAGQGYLAQVLSFQYQLSVVAIDASSHHGKITNARAQRIKKHYAAKMRKYLSGHGIYDLSGPRIVTCQVLSTDALNALSDSLQQNGKVEQQMLIDQSLGESYHDGHNVRKPTPCNATNGSSVLLAGLHACGDLSVTMLRTFLECEDVKAVISIGCCYNLLSEEGSENVGSQCGFPMSKGVKSYSLSMGKSSFDLACQSAERWRSLGKEAGLHNFELHAFRAAFQMLLYRCFPEALTRSPVIGRQGKALRRQQQRKTVECSLCHDECKCSSFPQENFKENGNCPALTFTESATDEGSMLNADSLFHGTLFRHSAIIEGNKFVEKYSLFEKFSQSGLHRLGLKPLQGINCLQIWKETAPFHELIGPYWSLRAALGPLLETFLLLDRLLFLQEQGSSIEAVMLPIFDPALSPRNVAIVARKI
ncbi:uncharacterized protein LOC131162464 isoform X2 [Malania oleifera]|uniref:uncharacterized protein LOC131162464 isoform X2 n=1 Tax=Malania oleifera TaxID=397392 RepID=UPI0025AE1485|nr:uncharacterized protein LOC131162464 isoform X2 [Malania oleifera]